MKKITLLLVVGVFLASPLTSHASILTDFANWLVPSELKPTPTPVVVATQKGAGGVLITPDPVIVSGDTTDSYLIPALGKRKFTIDNNGTIDLFLNKSSELYYSATPNLAPGDVPASIALNVGSERVITIANPSPRVNYYLSKTDLGVTSTSSTTETTIFITNPRASSAIVNGKEGQSSLASFTFGFTLNNATNNDMYISRLIDKTNFVTLSDVMGAVTSIKFVETDVRTKAGDSAQAYVIPAGSNRAFEITGIIDNTKGTRGPKTLSVTSIKYSNNPDLSALKSLGASELRNLLTVIYLDEGEILKGPVQTNPPQPSVSVAPTVTVAPTPTVSETPTVTPTPTVTVTPSPSVVVTPPPPKPSPSVTNTPTVTPSPSTSVTPSPSASVTATAPVPGFFITSAATSVRSPIMDDNQVIGYPVTFTFTTHAVGKGVYISKMPATAFATLATGFGPISPTINSITSPIKTGDRADAFFIAASTTRTFEVFAVLRNDGITKSGTQTFQITKIFYGMKSTALTEASTTEKTSLLKATVKLGPPTATVSPSASPTQSPSVTTSPTASPSATQSPDLIALCYGIPSNPETGELVTWQAMASGGSGTISYNWGGTDGLTGTGATVKKAYTTIGKKNALVGVVAGTQSVTASCYVTVVTPAPSPTATASPSVTESPSSTASPSGSGDVSKVDGNKSIVAAALYSLGEILDSLLH